MNISAKNHVNLLKINDFCDLGRLGEVWGGLRGGGGHKSSTFSNRMPKFFLLLQISNDFLKVGVTKYSACAQQKHQRHLQRPL